MAVLVFYFLITMFIILKFPSLIARNFNPFGHFLFLTISISWFISLLAVPLYQLLFQPDKLFLLGDSRLKSDYLRNLTEVMFYIVMQLGLTFIIALIILKSTKARKFLNFTDFKSEIAQDKYWRWLIPFDFLAKIALIIDQPAIWRAFNIFGTLGIFLYFVCADFKLLSQKFFGAIILIWAAISGLVSTGSKFQIFVGLFAITFRLFESHSILINKLIVSLTLIPSLFLFAYAQKLLNKGSSSSLEMYFENTEPNSIFTLVKVSSLLVLQRADGSKALVDAIYLQPEKWQSIVEYMKGLLIGLIPKGPLLRIDQNYGELWFKQVRSQSESSFTPPYPVAFGPGAEGIAIFGTKFYLINVAIWSIFIVLIFGYLAVRSFYGFIFSMSSALVSNSIFETGLYGLTGTINKAFQATLAVILIRLIVKSQKLRMKNST